MKEYQLDVAEKKVLGKYAFFGDKPTYRVRCRECAGGDGD